MAMNEQERRAYLKKKFEAVVTRSCITRLDSESKRTEYKVGDVIQITHEFGDELVSLNKAVVKDSLEHQAWKYRSFDLGKKKKEADNLAAANKRIAELETELAKEKKK